MPVDVGERGAPQCHDGRNRTVLLQGYRRALLTLWVSGHFNNSFTAHAGTTAQREYACAYLTTPNAHGRYRITVARASNAYTVTN